VPLWRSGVRVLGTSPEAIDHCEDRSKFSALLDALQVDQVCLCTLSSVWLSVRSSGGFPASPLGHALTTL
jgi:carbamoylphosphate synthase large subunit